MGKVPTELIIYILGLLYYTEEGLPDRTRLWHCSLVCKIWQQASQELLFRAGSLDRNKQTLESLQDIFSNPIIGSYVRCIKLSVGLEQKSHKNGAYSSSEFLQIITMFPRLYEIYIHAATPATDHDLVTTLDNHALAPLPPIKSLKFTSVKRSSLLLYRLLALWPSIEFLSFDQENFLQVASPPQETPSFRLKQLEYQSPPPLEVLEWLVPNESLQILHLKQSSPGLGQESKRRSEAFVALQGPSLRSLRVSSMDVLSPITFTLCSNLEELDVTHMTMELQDQVIQSLPKTIYHLRVRDTTFVGGALRSLIRVLPNLRRLTLPKKLKWLTGNRREHLVEFQRECVECDVSVVYETFWKYVVRSSLSNMCLTGTESIRCIGRRRSSRGKISSREICQ